MTTLLLLGINVPYILIVNEAAHKLKNTSSKKNEKKTKKTPRHHFNVSFPSARALPSGFAAAQIVLQ